MVDFSVKIDISQAQAALDALDPRALTLKIANAVADEVVLPALHKYPPQSGKKMQWASEKQRRFVMAQIRAGAIQVPYRRSGDYGRSFQKQQMGDGVNLVSGLAYAPYVRGPGQAAYHRGTWDTLEDLATQLEGDAALAATAAIVEAIGDAGP